MLKKNRPKHIVKFLFAFIILAIVVLFIGSKSLPEDFEKIESFAVRDTSETRLGETIAPLMQQHPSKSGFHMLTDGIEAFAARKGLVGAADKTIDLQYYIWKEDLTGKILIKQLLAAANRGVRVRLLLDDLYMIGKDDILRVINSHPQIEVRVFNPFANRSSPLWGFATDFKRSNRRMHNKSLTADNQASIIGGRNVGDEYFNATEFMVFKDLDALTIGPVVKDISKTFDLYWNSEWAYPISAFYQQAEVPEKTLKEIAKNFDAFIEEAAKHPYQQELQTLLAAKQDPINQIHFEWSDSFLSYDQPSKIVAKEMRDDTHLAPKLIESISSAKEEVLIVNPYFIPGKNGTKLLVDLVKRGVKVRVLTNSLSSNNVPLVHAGYMRYRKELLQGGVELYEIKPVIEDEEEAAKIDWRNLSTSRAGLHGKYFSLDNRYAFVGSFNMDARSVYSNTEIGVYFESPYYVSHLKKYFDTEITHKGYKLQLNKNKLEWITYENGEELIFKKEPGAGFQKRMTARIFSWFIPEGLL